MGLRGFIGLIIGVIFSWVIIYFIVFNNSLADFINSIQLGYDSIKINLINICLIQFSVYPFLFSGNFILIIPLVLAGLIFGLITGKYSSSLTLVLIYSLVVFIIPLSFFIIDGLDIFLAINNILFLFIGPSVLQIIVNIIMFEIFVSIPAILGAAITKKPNIKINKL